MGKLAQAALGTALRFGGVFAGVIAAQLLSAALWNHHGGTHIAWFPGAVLLCALLSSSRRDWPGLMAAAWAGLVVSGVAFGLPVVDTAIVVAPPVLLVPFAAWTLRRLSHDAPLLENFARLLVFSIIAAVLLPAASASLIEVASAYTALRGSILGSWPNVALSHALGYMLYVPVWASVRRPRLEARQGLLAEFILAMAGVVGLLGVSWVVLGRTPALIPLLCLAPAAIVVAACFRAQMAGSSIAVFAIGLMAAHLSVSGRGPFVAETSAWTTLAVQLWTLAASVCALIVATIVEQREAGQRALDRARHDIRELAGRLIATQEQERARMARDLHDDINQRLAAASMGLSALRRRVPPAEADAVSRLQSQMLVLSEDLRRVSHQLHPSWLEHVGLRDALESLCARPSETSAPRVRLSVDPAANALPQDIVLCFYRIVQEALNNALHHAGASMVTVDVSVSAQDAALRIVDDGRGFDTTAMQPGAAGIGLTSMHERAKLLAGSFDLRSQPGKGVQLHIRVPLNAS